MMFSFKKKNITDLTLGEILQQTREEKNISLEKVAKVAKMNPEYLRALEKGEYQKLPKGIYGRSFLREYCFYLKIDYKKMLAVYEEESPSTEELVEKKEVFSHKRVSQRHLLSLPKIIRNIILVIVIGAFFVFLGFRVRAIIAPPQLIITNPEPGQVIDNTRVEVIGSTESEVRIFVNNQEVFGDNNGAFSEIINLKQGINTIIVTAKKRYGRDAEVIRQVLVK